MASFTDRDPLSNDYFFLTNFTGTFGLGKNSFVVNPTTEMSSTATITASVYDRAQKLLFTQEVKVKDARFAKTTPTGRTFYVKVDSTTELGIGRIQVVGTTTGGDVVTWSRNVLIDPTAENLSEVRFFDDPEINVVQKAFQPPAMPAQPYAMAQGAFFSKAVTPSNNYNGDFDKQGWDVVYQITKTSGTDFSSLMNGEKIRLKDISVRQFIYNDQSNHDVYYQGVLNTDFIATISQVVNKNTLLINVPFVTMADIITQVNQNSEYRKNDLTQLEGYTAVDDKEKQTVYQKKNYYCLSIDAGNFEIVYPNVSETNSRSSSKTKTVLHVELRNLRTLCGKIASYRVYGRSLAYPQSKNLLFEGKTGPVQLIRSNNFDNGVRGDCGHFYSPSYLSQYWLTSGAVTFSQDHSVLIDGATISHSANTTETDYVIFKDNTTEGSRTSAYVPSTLLSGSYWYAKSDAFSNRSNYPASSYNVPSEISSFQSSQENLLNGSVHNSNPIKLIGNALYKFSMKVKATAGNSDASMMNVYFLSNEGRMKIGTIGSAYNYGADRLYENTFFVPNTLFGTIILVPIAGSWSISELTLSPNIDAGYSPDYFEFDMIVPNRMPNEPFEIDVELYDGSGKLAYGNGSYSFVYNRTYQPLSKKLFIDPAGLATP